ncbi:MAG: asparagine synthase (glutamine-hydrolyzing) [Sphingobacteriales bacterium]|nr:MAG: asparagine synthase (glutamine-hydrolyzing) [Sphingobacteriales bacterium]
MCRITGIFNPSSQNLSKEIINMRDAMKHGGPDDEGIYLDEDFKLALGHRRLALIDLSPGGHQPMADLNNQLQIVFNGEIYNYQALRSILKNFGYHFSTASDTEVILKAYQHWGVECFKYFDGMFALALWDKQHNQLILARDHAGIKPLYYYLSHTCLYFASEIRGFDRAAHDFEENELWKTYFLSFGSLPEPITTLKHVIPVKKGTAVIIDIPSLEKKEVCFYKLTYSEEIKFRRDALLLVRTKLEEAVERHLISDAPIGLFLSGGIDSSLLTLIARKFHGDHLHTLSITFDEQEFSEEKFQKIIIQKTKAHHQSFRITKSLFFESLPDVMKAMDQPTVDGINSYFISRCAHEYGLKAVLSGLGADELFGGYPSFQLSKNYSLLRMVPGVILNNFKYTGDYRLKKLGYAAMKNNIGEYLIYRGLFVPQSIARVLDSSEKEVINSLNALEDYYTEQSLKNGNRVSSLETSLYMQNQLLKDTDFMSMWHALEIRVPFLDRFLMNTAAQIDSSIKYQSPKYLLIEAFKDELPEAIWNRKKQGFTFPFANWFKDVAFIKPSDKTEERLFKDFSANKLSWSRYWSVILMNRFGKTGFSLQ